MRRDGLHCIDDIRVFEGFAGAYVAPGIYTAQVMIGDATASAQLTLVEDRRVTASRAEFSEVELRIEDMTRQMNEMLTGLEAIRQTRSQVEMLMAGYPDSDYLGMTGGRAIERLTEWEEKVVQVEFETYEDEDNLPGKLVKQTRHLLDVIDNAGPPVASGAKERLGDLQSDWAELQDELRDIFATDINAINDWAEERSVLHVNEM
jgi:hypothetical protein